MNSKIKSKFLATIGDVEFKNQQLYFEAIELIDMFENRFGEVFNNIFVEDIKSALSTSYVKIYNYYDNMLVDAMEESGTLDVDYPFEIEFPPELKTLFSLETLEKHLQDSVSWRDNYWEEIKHETYSLYN